MCVSVSSCCVVCEVWCIHYPIVNLRTHDIHTRKTGDSERRVRWCISPIHPQENLTFFFPPSSASLSISTEFLLFPPLSILLPPMVPSSYVFSPSIYYYILSLSVLWTDYHFHPAPFLTSLGKKDVSLWVVFFSLPSCVLFRLVLPVLHQREKSLCSLRPCIRERETRNSCLLLSTVCPSLQDTRSFFPSHDWLELDHRFQGTFFNPWWFTDNAHAEFEKREKRFSHTTSRHVLPPEGDWLFSGTSDNHESPEGRSQNAPVLWSHCRLSWVRWHSF